MPGGHRNDRHSFLTISDNVLNVGGSAGGKKQVSRHQPQSGDLPVGAGGGTKNGAAANFAKALQQQLERCKKYIDIAGPTLKKSKNKRASIYNCSLFINIFRKLSKHTPYKPKCGERRNKLKTRLTTKDDICFHSYDLFLLSTSLPPSLAVYSVSRHPVSDSALKWAPWSSGRSFSPPI